nr:transposase [Candidatus Sigynarchaeum springense]
IVVDFLVKTKDVHDAWSKTSQGNDITSTKSDIEKYRAFLEDASHRMRFVYTPKYCSWLNQVECWFSILARKLLKRETFTSVEDLKRKILAFIAYYNETMAEPFKWTYSGRPLATA